MNTIVLRNQTEKGEPLEVTFLPEKGMNMISYKKGDIEVIDQSTRADFEERFSGLGPLIGPHFHRRHAEIVPHLDDESLFPHIATVRAQGNPDPFSHGIGRYAPWSVEATETHVSGKLTGKDVWNGVPLEKIEGQNFTMKFDAELTPTGLQIKLSVVSDIDSIVGIHYYYHLPKGTGKVISQVQDTYIDLTVRKPIPADWDFNDQHILTFDLDQSADFTFAPFPDRLEGNIVLDTGVYRLLTTYHCLSEENAWQLYHPKGASFVCIEPVSSQDPRHANLTVSSLNINLQIMDPV